MIEIEEAATVANDVTNALLWAIILWGSMTIVLMAGLFLKDWLS